MIQVRLRRTLILFVIAMMMTPVLSFALSAGDGDVPSTDGGPGFVGAGEGIEPVSIEVDIYEDTFTPLMPWPTNRTLYGIHWRPGGDYALMVGSGGSLYKVTLDEVIPIRTGTDESLYDVAWKTDGSEALIVGNHSALFTWDAVAEDLTKVDIYYDQRFLGATWDPAGEYAIIVGNGGFIGRFNGTGVAAMNTGLIDFLYRIRWRPNADYALAVGDGGLVVLVNTTDIVNSTRLEVDWGLWRLDWAPGGSYALIAGKDYRFLPPRSIVVRYNATGTFDSLPLPDPTISSGLRAVHFTSNGPKAAIVGENSTVLKWDTQVLSDLNAPYDRTFRGCTWEPASTLPEQGLLVVGNRGVMMRSVLGAWTNRSFDPRENLHAIDWRPQGDYGLAVGVDGHISKVSLTGGKVISSPKTVDLFDVDWSSDGSYALICGGGGTVLRYDDGNDAVTIVRESVLALRGISIKPDSNEALAVGDGGHVWHFDKGIWTDKKMVGDGRNLWDVAWRPDGAFAIIVGVSGSVLNFTGTGLAQNFFPQPDTFAPFFSVTWDKDGDFAMIVGARDTTKDHDNIWVYDNRNIGPVGSDTGKPFYGCAFTADGEVGVAFGDKSNVVKFSTRTYEGTLTSFRSPYTYVQRGCMHPTGRAVYFAGSNGYAYRMDVGEFQNSPPVAIIEAPDTGSIHETGAVVELSANGSWDADGDALAFTWESNISGRLAHEKVAHVVFEDPGWHRVTLYVDDGMAHNVTEYVIIKLVVPNYPPIPVINSPLDGQTFTNEDVITFDGNGSFDPNGDNITYHWVSSLSGDIGYEEHVESLLRVGNHQIWLWVEDPEGARAGEFVNITVTQANRPPIVYITAPIEGQRYEPGEEVELNASYSFDPDDDPLTFVWLSDVDGALGEGAVLKVLLSEGPHLLSVTADDGKGPSSTAVVNITVEPPENRPPVLTLSSPPSNTTVSGVVTVAGTTYDPEGNPVTVRYAISIPDDWENAVQEGTGWSFDWDTTSLANQQYSVFIEASDGVHTTRIFAQFFVDNAPPENTPPTVTLDGPPPGKVKGMVNLKGLATDPDGDPITKVEVRFDSGLWEPATGTSIWSYQWDTSDTPNGAVTVTVRAYDGKDWSEYMSYDYEVANTEVDPQGGTDWTLWALVLVVLLVVAIAAWFLYSRR